MHKNVYKTLCSNHIDINTHLWYTVITERGKDLRKNTMEEMKMANTWKVKALTVKGNGTERVENGLRIYTPPKAEWTVLREFTDPEEAEIWMTDYIRMKGLHYEDFKITR